MIRAIVENIITTMARSNTMHRKKTGSNMVIRTTQVTPKRGITRSGIECTRIKKRISKNITSILKFKWI